MKTIIRNIENKAIRKYGFESKATILIFRITNIPRIACKMNWQARAPLAYLFTYKVLTTKSYVCYNKYRKSRKEVFEMKLGDTLRGSKVFLKSFH